MSANHTILIPEDPTYVPSAVRQKRAVKRFWEIAPGADEIRNEVSEGIRFIMSGANFQRIICPSCGAEIDKEWWWSSIDDDYDPAHGFSLNLLQLPCCGTRVTLNEMKYDWPQGFGKYSLEALNAGVGELSDTFLKEFEQILGCSLRVIYQHI